MKETEIERLRQIIAANNWIFAKTYAKTAPHEYMLRKECDDEDFVWFVKMIRTHGESMPFFGKSYIYLFIDHKKYWTMGAPVEETLLINRCDV